MGDGLVEHLASMGKEDILVTIGGGDWGKVVLLTIFLDLVPGGASKAVQHGRFLPKGEASLDAPSVWGKDSGNPQVGPDKVILAQVMGRKRAEHDTVTLAHEDVLLRYRFPKGWREVEAGHLLTGQVGCL